MTPPVKPVGQRRALRNRRQGRGCASPPPRPWSGNRRPARRPRSISGRPSRSSAMSVVVPPISDTSASAAPVSQRAPDEACRRAAQDRLDRAAAGACAARDQRPVAAHHHHRRLHAELPQHVLGPPDQPWVSPISRALSTAVSARFGPPSLAESSCEQLTGRPVAAQIAGRAPPFHARDCGWRTARPRQRRKRPEPLPMPRARRGPAAPPRRRHGRARRRARDADRRSGPRPDPASQDPVRQSRCRPAPRGRPAPRPARWWRASSTAQAMATFDASTPASASTAETAAPIPDRKVAARRQRLGLGHHVVSSRTRTASV